MTNIQESVIKISPDLSTVLDLFTPSNWSALDQRDHDFGSGGVLVLPDQPGSYPHLAVAAGKVGSMFLLMKTAWVDTPARRTMCWAPIRSVAVGAGHPTLWIPAIRSRV